MGEWKTRLLCFLGSHRYDQWRWIKGPKLGRAVHPWDATGIQIRVCQDCGKEQLIGSSEERLIIARRRDR